MRLEGKNVLVVGLGRSGLAATRFLLKEGARVAVTDQRSEAELKMIELDRELVERHLGGHPPEIFERRDLICLSPGVSGDLPGLNLARRRGIPILGEMGLAAERLEVPFVAVTGTNGKSTTATLIQKMLEAGGQRVALAGNIGRPLLEIVMERKKYDRVVVEVSSFQLETVRRFRPEVALLLNITEDHLDRYADFRDYVRAKMRIVKDQTRRDAVVYNGDDPELRSFRSVSQKIPFSKSPLETGLFLLRGRIVRKWKDEFEEYSLDRAKLQGIHNLENMMAAIGAARLVGVSPDAIRKTLESFEGLSHRMQFVRELRGVRFFDDSKGTNVDAARKSIQSFEGRCVILVAGGRAKGYGFAPLRGPVSEKVKLLLSIGEASSKLAKELEGATEIREVGHLERAVSVAMGEACPGDVVLLSPACASFDQFKNFEERGNRFQELVKQYA